MRVALASRVLFGGMALLSACALNRENFNPRAGDAIANRSAEQRGHFIEALFYAFGGNNNEMAIFKVSYRTKIVERKIVSIPYTHLYGSCSDKFGNVFVTQHSTSHAGNVIEFAHAGTSAIATLSDSGTATACSYDRTTGRIAVANAYDAQAPGGPGPDIAVYARTPSVRVHTILMGTSSLAERRLPISSY